MSAPQVPQTFTVPLTQNQLQHIMSQGLFNNNQQHIPQDAMNANAQVTHNQFGGSSQASSSQPAQTQQPKQPKQDKKKRTLNCFVAFRCYVSPLFHTFQQKDRSGFVKVMWSVELVKAKWTIIAKAYSIIRDEVGSENAPMDAFLTLACPHIGIISRADYLSTLGWDFVNNGNGWVLDRRFTPSAASLPQGYLTTTLSVDDMVKFVRGRGYGISPSTAASNVGSSTNAGAPALTMAAQPVQPTQTVLQPAQPTQATVQPVQAAQPGPHFAHLIHQSVALSEQQSTVSSGEAASHGTLAHNLTEDLTDDELSQILALDPDPETCSIFHFNHTDPVYHDKSINSQLTHPMNDQRWYFGSNASRLKFVEVAPEKPDTMGFGEKAFQKLASDFWNSESEYPHNDQFVPGRHYTNFSDYEPEIMPDFDAFDMHRLANAWPADEEYVNLLSQNQG